MTERDRILSAIAKAINTELGKRRNPLLQVDAIAAADAALRELEAPARGTEDYSRICTCGQNGFPENSPHSNHPHFAGCPQYIEK